MDNNKDDESTFSITKLKVREISQRNEDASEKLAEIVARQRLLNRLREQPANDEMDY